MWRDHLRKLTGFFILLIIFVSGCNSEQKSTDIATYTDNPPPYIKTVDDIIDRHGTLENKERFDDFLNRVQQGKDDSIRVIKYTTEGAPIIYSYEFKSDEISVTIDTTRDGYGQSKIGHTTCTSIKVNEDKERTNYELVGCTPLIGDTIILTVDVYPE